MDIRFTDENLFQLEADGILFFTDNSLLGEKTNLIIEEAGERIIEPIVKQNGCATGEVKIVPGFSLSAKYVLLSVLPDKGQKMAKELFRNILLQTFKITLDYNLNSVGIDLYYIKHIFNQDYVAILNEVLTELKSQNIDILVYLCKGNIIDNDQ